MVVSWQDGRFDVTASGGEVEGLPLEFGQLVFASESEERFRR